MASYGHVTAHRCAQLGRALSAAGLVWSDNGHQEDPQFLTYTVTDRQGRTWSVSAATNFQCSPSAPARIWVATCPPLLTTSPVLSAGQISQHIRAAA